MQTEQFDSILRHTLQDHRISRGEKRVLQSVIKEMGADENRLALLRHRAFEIARQEVMSPEADAVLNWLEDVVKALQPGPAAPSARDPEAYFSPGEQCVNAVVGLLRRAQRAAEICVFTITDNRIADAIRDAHRRRVNVRIITDNDKAADLGSDIAELRRAGITVRVDQTDYHMHHKFAIIDRSALITGSYNWTRSAADFNEENIIVSFNAPLIQRFADVFEKLWDDLG